MSLSHLTVLQLTNRVGDVNDFDMHESTVSPLDVRR